MIATLALPEEVGVSKQWANHINFHNNAEGVTAYAKVAGANWTYYVKDLVIRIGRPPDKRESVVVSETVHIDLGPSKLVSRNHATISYDTNGEHCWQIHVLGRNGVKVDEEMFKRDTKTVLRSGSVIEIGGVQMMFVLPNKVPEVAEAILQRARLQQFVVEEEPPILLEKKPAAETVREVGTVTQTVAPPAVETRTRTGPVSAAASGFQRGLVMESAEDVDYTRDDMKEVKPPFSYALMIAQAILSSETEQLTLASIYQFIQDKYSFYRHSHTGWQVSRR